MHVKDMLPAGNFEVIEAKDGLEGYNLIRSELPNLIMLDFLLPKMSGWEVFQAIQKDYNLKTIPLVLMSGRKEEVIEKISEPFEFFAFIEKPFDQKQLVAAIKEAMTKAKKHPKPVQEPKAKPVSPPETPQSDTSSLSADIQALNDKINKMQDEIDGLKKQMVQLVIFIRKKLS